MPRVTFLPSGRTCQLSVGGTLLRAVLRARLPMARACRGVGICAGCRVRVVEGLAHLDPMGPRERQLADREPLGADERYACQARVRADVTITTTYW